MGGTEVVLAFQAGSGLRNPARGTYTVRVNSSREAIWVTSGAYLILLFMDDSDAVVAPNPAQGDKVKFFYNVAESGEVEIDLYNVLGERVAQIVERKTAEKGASSVWHLERVGSGVYLARIKLRYDSGAETKLAPKKVIVINSQR